MIIKKELRLPDIIKRKAKRNSSFLELDPEKQEEILVFIKNNNLNIKVFGKRWYDVLTKKFYVDEFEIDKREIYGFSIKSREFDDFYQYYNYIQGDIYSCSCYFGYVFSKEEIEKYSIEIGRVNFDSFIHKKTIDLYTFEYINSINSFADSLNKDRTNEIASWV